MSRLKTWLGLCVALLALAGGCDLKSALPGSSRASFHGIDITGADYAKSLVLPDVQGRMRSLTDWKGQVVVVFFGYTQCPDVCPTTLVELAEAKRELGADGQRVQVVFVTLDPERDTAAVLKAYVDNFEAGFTGLRGDAEQTRAVAREFKVFFAKVPGKTETSYTVDHTAGSYIFDTQGRIRLFTRYGGGAKALAQDIRKLLAEAPPV